MIQFKLKLNAQKQRASCMSLLLLLIFGIWERIQNIGFPPEGRVNRDPTYGHLPWGRSIPCPRRWWLGESFLLGLE